MITVRFVKGALAAALVVTTGGLLARVGEDLIYERLIGPLLASGPSGIGQALLWQIPGLALAWVVIFLFVFLPSLGALKHVVRQALESRARMTSDPVGDAKPVLIMGLSPLSPEVLREIMIDAEAEHIDAGFVGLPEPLFRARALDVAGSGLRSPHMSEGGRVNTWQQNIRAMALHAEAGVLRKVIVLPSERSMAQFEAFRDYAQRLFARNGKTFDVEPVWRPDARKTQAFFWTDRAGRKIREYEDYDYVRSGLLHALGQARAAGYQEADMVIDATAGQKVFSIGAAIVTLNRNMKFSYVTTGPDGGRVVFYDAHVDLGTSEAG